MKALIFALACSPALVLAQHQMTAGHSRLSDTRKIADAMSAAPKAISKNATVMDFPAKEGAPMRQLRAGTNGWLCLPSTPTNLAPGADPMCLDKNWQELVAAWMEKRPPKLTGAGIAYMLRGDKGASNTDPYATDKTTTNAWVVSPPHIMVVFEDQKSLDAFPTDPKSGGPWVMWKGTPYAHLMIPVSPSKAAK